MNSKEKIAYLWRIGRKPKAYTKGLRCIPYLKVFKNDLYLIYKYVLSNKPC